MRARFLHFADCHLGYRQYNSKDRFNDFARAFLDVIDTAIREQVDFVILAGDLFQKRAIDALTLNQAMIGLERLKAASIPCIAVEGNHEHAYFEDYIGWMEFLADRQLFVLLDAEYESGEPQLTPYGRRSGSYIDPVPGLRVHGLRYYGASTPKAVATYAEALAGLPDDGIEYTIFVTHAGMEGVLSEEAGGLSFRQMAPLRKHSDYVALGHIHKPYEMENWIYNPGSTETCTTAEAVWGDRGYYLVDVDTERDGSKHVATLHANRRRPFHRIVVKTDLHTSPDALMTHSQTLLERRTRDLSLNRLPPERRPVIELQLTGVLPFDRGALDIQSLEEMVNEICDPLLVLVRNFTRSSEFEIEAGEGLSRNALERQVLNDLFARDARYSGLSGKWTRLALNMKQMILEGASPEAIVDDLEVQIQTLVLADDGSESSGQRGVDDADLSQEP